MRNQSSINQEPCEEEPPEDTIHQDREQPTEPLEGKNPAAVALGRLGGLKGGKARAAQLSPDERSEIAKRAAQARWSKRE
jgi:hypothetical protein